MTPGIALTDVSRQYRKVLVLMPFIGAAVLLLSFVLGHPIAGATFCFGLLLGLINSRLMIGATARLSEGAAKLSEEGGDVSESAGAASKTPFIVGSLKRLGAITLAAAVVGYFFRPDGLAVVVGLGVFQLTMMVGVAGPLLREVRQ